MSISVPVPVFKKSLTRYRFFEERKASFCGHEIPSMEYMTSNGFIYKFTTRNGPQIQCYFCAKRLCLERYFELKPHEPKLNKKCELSIVHYVRRIFEQPNVTKFSFPFFSDQDIRFYVAEPNSYQSVTCRKMTFGGLKIREEDLDKLATCGYFYYPLAYGKDAFMCMYCGFILLDYSNFDLLQNSHKEYAKGTPYGLCHFLDRADLPIDFTNSNVMKSVLENLFKQTVQNKESCESNESNKSGHIEEFECSENHLCDGSGHTGKLKSPESDDCIGSGQVEEPKSSEYSCYDEIGCIEELQASENSFRRDSKTEAFSSLRIPKRKVASASTEELTILPKKKCPDPKRSLSLKNYSDLLEICKSYGIETGEK